MDTLRSFADAVLPKPENPRKPKFWNKPDSLSELFELRKLTAPQTNEVPPTDLFEYYWAYQAEGTKFAHIISWAITLLFRRPANVPRHLLFLWWTIWTLTVIVAVAILVYVGRHDSLSPSMLAANGVVGLLASIALSVISAFVINYVGDAARYLDPRPPNIAMRQRIRKEGIELLQRLHECRDYDRVIVVGHSLGSVIAYDLVRHLWPKYNTAHGRTAGVPQPVNERLDAIGESLVQSPTPERFDAFREAQLALWKEERHIGNPWLITDVITLGSPLAHAALLLADTPKDLRERQDERELPTCPPVVDEGSYSYGLAYEEGSTTYRYRALHHAAMFACTRWTNLYFPAPLGLLGDLVGGRVADVFGPGVRDVAVTSAEAGGLLQHTPVIHTHYWSPRTIGTRSAAPVSALEALRSALALDSRAWLREVATSGDHAAAI